MPMKFSAAPQRVRPVVAVAALAVDLVPGVASPTSTRQSTSDEQRAYRTTGRIFPSRTWLPQVTLVKPIIATSRADQESGIPKVPPICPPLQMTPQPTKQPDLIKG
jgi:hypothetical protein